MCSSSPLYCGIEPNMPGCEAKIGQIIPNFKGKTLEGNINLHDWLGVSWGVVFTVSGAFGPICTTEVGALAKRADEFEKRNCKLLGISCDNMKTVIPWIRDIISLNNLKDFKINMLADEGRQVVPNLGSIEPSYMDLLTGMPLPCRGLFIVDPNKILATKSFLPWSFGMNIDYLLSIIDQLQMLNKQGD